MTATIKRGFKAVMSSKTEIKIDPEEIDVVLDMAAKGRFIKTKQGVINPSFLVAIIEDEERYNKFMDYHRHDKERRQKGLDPLENIFEKEKLKLENKTAALPGSPPEGKK